MDRHAFKLSPAQQRKLLKGVSVQLKPSDLTGGDTVLQLPKTVSTRVNKAVRLGKGMRLQLSPEQLELNGGSLKSFGRALNRGAKKVKRFLKANSKPILSTAVRIIAPVALKMIQDRTGIPVANGATQKAIIDASVKGIEKSPDLPGGKKKGGPKQATPAIDLAAAMRPDLEPTLAPVREMMQDMDYSYDNKNSNAEYDNNATPVGGSLAAAMLMPPGGFVGKRTVRKGGALRPAGGALYPAGGALYPAGEHSGGAVRRRNTGVLLPRF